MPTEIYGLSVDASLRYSEILSEATMALPASADRAAAALEPIAGEVWMGRLSLHGATSPGVGSGDRVTRQISEKTKAEVFLRDGFLCTFCGYPTVPRCILVAISDVFPDVIPYYAHYRRGSVHPVYWALAPEADHVIPHASGGSNAVENLTTLHALCNTRKSNLAAMDIPILNRPATSFLPWDGLLSNYADIVIAGQSQGRRHSSVDYHPRWLRAFGRSADLDRVRQGVQAAG